ncbi:hypothetical protein HPB48_016367 [Haemaphysalis longicornis]|uniref:Uncharacterized protein n=1 Tax=Haemaphysalis longicornis TaxID=44386 RepID=A0A9J6GLL2_HAELO|nr:hypothetical protein HPB48_016367 [Haemaphysalis longicornis]
MYKFRNVSIPYDPSLAHKTSLQANAFSVFSVASTFPSLAAVYLGTLFNHKLKHETRNILGFCLCIAFFVMVTAFVKVDTDNYISSDKQLNPVCSEFRKAKRQDLG